MSLVPFVQYCLWPTHPPLLMQSDNPPPQASPDKYCSSGIFSDWMMSLVLKNNKLPYQPTISHICQKSVTERVNLVNLHIKHGLKTSVNHAILKTEWLTLTSWPNLDGHWWNSNMAAQSFIAQVGTKLELESYNWDDLIMPDPFCVVVALKQRNENHCSCGRTNMFNSWWHGFVLLWQWLQN